MALKPVERQGLTKSQKRSMVQVMEGKCDNLDRITADIHVARAGYVQAMQDYQDTLPADKKGAIQTIAIAVDAALVYSEAVHELAEYYLEIGDLDSWETNMELAEHLKNNAQCHNMLLAEYAGVRKGENVERLGQLLDLMRPGGSSEIVWN